MVSITTKYGTFEADTIRKANALAKKAEKEAAVLQEQRNQDFGYALARAKSIGFDWMAILAESGTIYADLVRPGDECAHWYTSTGKDTDHEGNPYTTYLHYVRPGVTGGEKWAVSHWGKEFVGVILNLGGVVLGYITRNRADGEVRAIALGIVGDQEATVHVPGVLPEHFSRKRANKANEQRDHLAAEMSN